MEGGSNLEAVPEDDLVVIPRPQNAQAPSNKRTFQKRRRSRACDACRLRKTKVSSHQWPADLPAPDSTSTNSDQCDAPPEGICTSCASASLLCKFSDSEHEKKKIGPARRLRMLETTVQELNEKLKIAEAKLQSGERGGDVGLLDVESSSTDSHSVALRRKSESPSTSTTTGHSPNELSPRPSLSLPLRSFSYDHSPNEDVFVGSTSGLGFLTSVKDYVERLGYDTTPLLHAWKDSEAKTYSINPTTYPEGSQIRDLRALLPPQEDGKKLLDIFYRNTPRYANSTILNKDSNNEANILIG
ncbi:hypothetical protein ABW21_db0207699 [Orbilia brochopaga]|nr:hypothetical protein ABW21_db0207699 [Drechslerella brochopaga]